MLSVFKKNRCIELIMFMGILLMFVAYLVSQNHQLLPASESEKSATQHQKLQCVSYSPYYGDKQSPVVAGMHIERSQIEQDLKRLASLTNCVRTYAVAQGLDVVPEVAQSLGLKVYLGAWVGWTDKDNLAEISLAVKRANAYPNTVKGIIVGNEVLLRREQPEAKIQQYLQLAQQHTDVPVTYADVWEFWLKHPKLEQEVDFITVHILPYWEDAPVPIEEAANHTQNVMERLAKAFKKPLLIGETGWPSAGRQRFGAKPSLINEAHYVRDFLQKAERYGWQYNIIEAIDQPWKRDLEGTVGGYWGVFDTQLEAKFALDGNVYSRQSILIPCLLSIGLAVLLGAWVRFSGASACEQLSALVLGALLGLGAYIQWQYLWQACRNTQEWLALGGVTLVGDVVLLYLALAQQRLQSNVLNVMSFVLLASMLYASYYLYVDGRYRNFPLELYVLPVLVLLATKVASLVTAARTSFTFDWKAVLTGVIGLLAIILSVLTYRLEPQNSVALYWLTLVVLMTLVSLLKAKKA